MMTAEEFCKIKDKEIGESWSDDYEELPKIMEDYALLKMITYLKILPHDMFVDDVLNVLQEKDEVERVKKYL